MFCTYYAKLLVVIHVVFYSWNKGWRYLWLEMDSKNIFQLVSSQSVTIPWHWLSSWTECMSFISTMSFQASHIYQEGNAFVDAFSTKDVKLLKLQFWTDVLDFFRLFWAMISLVELIIDSLGVYVRGLRYLLFFLSKVFPTGVFSLDKF